MIADTPIPTSPAGAAPRRTYGPRTSRLLPAVVAVSLFVANNLAILSGWLDPPPGYRPMLMNRGSDFAVYVSWSQAFQSRLFLPDYTAPWRTEAAFFNLLPWAVGQTSRLLGTSVPVAYLIFHFSFYLVAAYALFSALREFTETRNQSALAVVFMAASLPLLSLTIIPTFVLTRGFWQHVPLGAPRNVVAWLAEQAASPRWNAWSPLPPVPGLGDFFWASSDGFFHGISSSVFVTFGTATTLLAFAFLARYLRTDQTRYLGYAALTTFVSAAVHPYEVVVIVSAGGLTLLLRAGKGWWHRCREGLLLGLSGAMGLAPLAYTALRYQWIHDAAEVNRWAPLPPGRMLLVLGLPTVAALVLLVVRPRMASTTDVLLQSWVVCTLVGMYIPWLPWTQHLLDGYHCAVGLLLARQVTQVPWLARLRMAFPRLTPAALALCCLLSATSYLTYGWQSFQDGRLALPARLFSTVAPVDELSAIAWMKQNARSDDLVLAPLDSAPWFAVVPMHSFAGHWSYSLTFDQQARLVNAFYAGELSRDAAQELLASYGIRYVVVPEGSPARGYLGDHSPRARLGTLAVYDLPGHTMKPYPGLPSSATNDLADGVRRGP